MYMYLYIHRTCAAQLYPMSAEAIYLKQLQCTYTCVQDKDKDILTSNHNGYVWRLGYLYLILYNSTNYWQSTNWHVYMHVHVPTTLTGTE